jgi:hypothetical protein
MSTTSSRRDHLTSTTKDAKIELAEEQLSRVTGGAQGVISPRDPQSGLPTGQRV